MTLRTVFLLVGVICSWVLVSGCASEESYRAEQEAGGSLPWNRPQSWEGPGALGSQMNQFSR